MKTPMINIVNQVLVTSDYTLFKNLEGNRNLNQLHIKRLKKSMEENYLLSPILVNEKMQIIDGQHRFNTAKSLGLPVYYIVAQGYGLKEVQTLNANSKNWNADDYLAGYIDMGLNDYVVYSEFKNKYGFGHSECMTLLAGRNSTSEGHTFYNGDFKVKSLKKAEQIGDFILKVKVFYVGAVRRSFIYAIVNLWDKPIFDAQHLLSQIQKNQSMLFDCPSMKAYLELIETIYNYRKREKVSLKY